MKQKKIRIPINDESVAQVLYDSDRTCCVCNEKGKAVQIHHIDENPSNNKISNLAALCFQCHEETQITGGFGRKLNAAQIAKFKDEWISRVRLRRVTADELASRQTFENNKKEQSALIVSNDENQFESDDEIYGIGEYQTAEFKSYIYKVAQIKQTVIKYAKQEWNKGATNIVSQATSEVTDFYEQVLNKLSNFYPSNHFEGDAKKYFNELIATRFHWHLLKAEIFGLDKGGSMMHIFIATSVMNDVNEMIKDMIYYLTTFKFAIDYSDWEKLWEDI